MFDAAAGHAKMDDDLLNLVSENWHLFQRCQTSNKAIGIPAIQAYIAKQERSAICESDPAHFYRRLSVAADCMATFYFEYGGGIDGIIVSTSNPESSTVLLNSVIDNGENICQWDIGFKEMELDYNSAWLIHLRTDLDREKHMERYSKLETVCANTGKLMTACFQHESCTGIIKESDGDFLSLSNVKHEDC